MDPYVRAAIEGAQHTEYELRAVRKVIPADFAGSSRILLTGVLDLVIQQQQPLTYQRRWQWDRIDRLLGHVAKTQVAGDVEIWDSQASRASTKYIVNYVRQLLTYAALCPANCLRDVCFSLSMSPTSLSALDALPWMRRSSRSHWIGRTSRSAVSARQVLRWNRTRLRWCQARWS